MAIDVPTVGGLSFAGDVALDLSMSDGGPMQEDVPNECVVGVRPSPNFSKLHQTSPDSTLLYQTLVLVIDLQGS